MEYYSKILFFREHLAALSSRQAITQSRKSRGLFNLCSQQEESLFKPKYDYKTGENACRISGTPVVKWMTGAFHLPNGLSFSFWADTWSLASLHITTLGHGYTSYSHVNHKSRLSRLFRVSEEHKKTYAVSSDLVLRSCWGLRLMSDCRKCKQLQLWLRKI